MKITRGESGQSMLPILLTAAAILTSLIIATSGLTGGSRSAKTAQVSVENDMLANGVYQVINSAASCSQMIQNGDNGTLIPYLVPAGNLGPPPVYSFNQGLYFSLGVGGKPFLARSTPINSLTIPSSATNAGALRLDPTGFVNYGTQPTTGSSQFTGTNCYLTNLHVETQAPASVYGAQISKFDFPLYIGVNALSGKIQACQGASAGSPCIAQNPIIIPSPNPTCQAVGGSATLNWLPENAAYEIIQSINPTGYGPVTLTAGPVSVPLPSPAPSGGIYTFSVTPYSLANTKGYPTTFSVSTSVAPTILAASFEGTSNKLDWTSDVNTAYVDIEPAPPAPGPSQGPNFTGLAIVPVPTPGQAFTLTPTNACGLAGTPYPVTYTGTTPSPTASPSASGSPTGTLEATPSGFSAPAAGCNYYAQPPVDLTVSPAAPTINAPGPCWQANPMTNPTQYRTEPVCESNPNVLPPIKLSGFGLTVPTSATINTVKISFQVLNQGNGNDGVVNNASLYYSGSTYGTVQTLTQAIASHTNNGAWPHNVSGDATFWGAALTPAVVNDPSFGMVVNMTHQAQRDFFNYPNASSIDVNYTDNLIFCTTPPASPSPTTSPPPSPIPSSTSSPVCATVTSKTHPWTCKLHNVGTCVGDAPPTICAGSNTTTYACADTDQGGTYYDNIGYVPAPGPYNMCGPPPHPDTIPGPSLASHSEKRSSSFASCDLMDYLIPDAYAYYFCEETKSTVTCTADICTDGDATTHTECTSPGPPAGCVAPTDFSACPSASPTSPTWGLCGSTYTDSNGRSCNYQIGCNCSGACAAPIVPFTNSAAYCGASPSACCSLIIYY